jgi:hypothetical protein
MVDPHSDTQYTCQILDGGDEPIVSIPTIREREKVWGGGGRAGGMEDSGLKGNN